MAMTADGKIATANRSVSSFGSEEDQDHLYALRAEVDAIMVGARTVDSAAVTLDSGSMAWRRQRFELVTPKPLVSKFAQGF